MQDFLWTIIGWICKGVSVMALLVLIIGVCHVIKFLVTNGNRKWHYYEPDKPWKGGYWAPLLPDYPPMSMNGILRHAAMSIKLPANRFTIVSCR